MTKEFVDYVYKCIVKSKGGIQIKDLNKTLQVRDSDAITAALEQLLILEVIYIRPSFGTAYVSIVENALTDVKH